MTRGAPNHATSFERSRWRPTARKTNMNRLDKGSRLEKRGVPPEALAVAPRNDTVFTDSVGSPASFGSDSAVFGSTGGPVEDHAILLGKGQP